MNTHSSGKKAQHRGNEKRTFVLVHGGWCGGWLWRDVAPALQKLGHVVTTPTLAGLGERRHLLNEMATLSTHIEDIVAHIEMEGFQDVSLVSHGYSGMVATGVLSRIPEKISSIIYLDALVPEDGESLFNLYPPEYGARYEAFRAENKPIAPLPLSVYGITDPRLIDFIKPRLVSHPWRTFFEPVKVIPRPAHVQMSYVRCIQYDAQHLDRILERIRKDPDVQIATINTTHPCMLTAPEATIHNILDLAT